jgi:hypothetical protein
MDTRTLSTGSTGMRARPAPLLRAAACAVLLGTAACAEDAVGPAPGQLTNEEIGELMGALGDMGTLDLDGGAMLGGNNLSTTMACPHGGEVVVSGSSSDGRTNGSEIVIDYDISMLHTDCGVGEPGRVFVLNGNPDLVQSGTIRVRGLFEFIAIDSRILGSLAWQFDGRSGVCDLDVTITSSASSATGEGTASISGTACGAPVTQELDL